MFYVRDKIQYFLKTTVQKKKCEGLVFPLTAIANLSFLTVCGSTTQKMHTANTNMNTILRQFYQPRTK